MKRKNWEMIYGDIDKYTEKMRAVYADAEEIMLKQIRIMLEQGIDASDIDIWKRQKLASLRKINDTINPALAELHKTDQLINDALTSAYDAGVAIATQEIINADLLQPKISAFTRGAGLKTLINETVKATSVTTRQVLRAAKDIYRQSVSEGAANAMTGTLTTREAVQQVLNRFADKGISGFTDSAGRSWTAPTYLEMAVRTTSANAAREGHLAKLAAADNDLVIVSSHGDCCAACSDWEGQVLSVSGNNKDYPSVDEAENDGLMHPNCRHTYGIYIEGFTNPDDKQEYDKQAYQDRQVQRYNERQLRQWNRRAAVAMTDQDKQLAESKVKQWNKIQRDHIKQANLDGEERHGDGWRTLRRDKDRETELVAAK